jgi:signal transduction histidine kinase
MQVGTLYVGLSLLAAVLTVALAAFAWRHRSVPGARWFIGLQFVNTAWILASTVALVVPASQVDARLAWATANLTVSVFVPVFWVAFTFEYAGDGTGIDRWPLLALNVVPVVTITSLLAPGLSDLVFVGWTINEFATLSVVSFDPGPWLPVQLLYTFALFIIGTVVVLRGVWSLDRSSRDRAVAVVVGTLAPLLTSVAVATGQMPVAGLDPTPVTLSVTGVAFGYALFRTQLFEFAPATRSLGEAAAVADLDDGVVIATDGGEILTMNPVARRLLDVPDVPDVDDVDAVFESVGVDREALPTQFETPDGRSVEVSASPITGRLDERIGQTLLLSDVTEQVRREQRLTVLNRVLRHNLRNDLGALRGHANILVENATEANAQAAAHVAATADDLVELGEKARQVERVLAREDLSRESVDVAARVADVAERTAMGYDADVEFDGSSNATLRTDPVVLEAVVRNAVENALEYGTDAVDTVSVSVSRADDGVAVRVADQGPGVPPDQLRVLESGSESPLEHADSLGLWLVQWGTTRLGGTVDFDSNDPRGTVLTLRLQSLDD